MADLTPELLAQLEEDVQGFPGRWESRFDEESDSIYYIDREGEAHEIAPDIEIEDVADPLARMLNAIPALVAAAKERVSLAWSNEQLGEHLAAANAECAHLREELAAERMVTESVMLSELAELREEMPRLRDELAAAKAQVAQLRHPIINTDEAAGYRKLEQVRALADDQALPARFAITKIREVLRG